MFANRVSELDLLERHHASDKAELFVLYGRRRVGKTELLARFCEGKRYVFFVADQVSESVLRAGLSKAINDAIFGNTPTITPYREGCAGDGVPTT